METVVINSLRELDALVAEKVMGVVNLDQWRINYRMDGTGHYSSEMNAAWEVVEKLKQPPSNKHVLISISAYWKALVEVEIKDFLPTQPQMLKTQAKTFPIAICLAALKTVGLEVTLVIDAA